MVLVPPTEFGFPSGRCEHGRVPVSSVARVATKSKRVVFEEDGSYIENTRSGKKIAIIKDRGTYAIEVEYMMLKTSEEDNEWGLTSSGTVAPKLFTYSISEAGAD